MSKIIGELNAAGICGSMNGEYDRYNRKRHCKV